MLSFDYLINTFAGALFVVSALLALVEQAVPRNSLFRARFQGIHKFFSSDMVQGAPGRTIENYEKRMLYRDAEGATSRFLVFIFIVDGAVLIPLHSYRALPHPYPTWEFALSPHLYYFVTLALILGFLRSFLRVMRSKGTSLDIGTMSAFWILSANVLMMHINFILAPKSGLIKQSFAEPAALLYLDGLLGQKLAVGIFIVVVGLCSYYIVSFLIMMAGFMFSIADHIVAGLARHASVMTLIVSVLFAWAYSVDPVVGFPNPPALKLYFLLLACSAGISASFLFATSRITRHPLIGTTALILIPSIGYVVPSALLGSQGELWSWAGLLALAVVFGPMSVPYLVVTFSGVASLTVIAGRHIFGTDEAAVKPFATLALFFALVGAASSFVALQYAYYTR